MSGVWAGRRVWPWLVMGWFREQSGHHRKVSSWVSCPLDSVAVNKEKANLSNEITVTKVILSFFYTPLKTPITYSKVPNDKMTTDLSDKEQVWLATCNCH